MNRSGYSEECDGYYHLWRGAVDNAIRGKRGQAFLKEMRAAMDAMPTKELITDALEFEGAVCAIGAVGRKRELNMGGINPEDYNTIADTFGIAPALAREIEYENDEYWLPESPSQRFIRMRRWVESNIKD